MTLRVLVLSLITLIGCSRTAPPEETKQKFDRYYAQWQSECQQPKVRIMSDSHAYTSLPGYRAIVALGRPVLPYLKEKMEHDSGFDFMLVFAAMEIERWKDTDFPNNTSSVQELRDHVLAKMQTQQ